MATSSEPIGAGGLPGGIHRDTPSTSPSVVQMSEVEVSSPFWNSHVSTAQRCVASGITQRQAGSCSKALASTRAAAGNSKRSSRLTPP